METFAAFNKTVGIAFSTCVSKDLCLFTSHPTQFFFLWLSLSCSLFLSENNGNSKEEALWSSSQVHIWFDSWLQILQQGDI